MGILLMVSAPAMLVCMHTRSCEGSRTSNFAPCLCHQPCTQHWDSFLSSCFVSAMPPSPLALGAVEETLFFTILKITPRTETDFAFDPKPEAHLDSPREMWFTTKLEKTPIGLHWFTASVQHDGAELSRTPRDVFFFVGRESAALEMRLREFKAADPEHARLRAWMDENVEGVRGMRAEPDPHGGLGLVADGGSISPGKIGFMPFSSCVGPESAVKSSAAAYLSPMFTNRKLPPELATAMLLLVQCFEDDPFFGPYIATLPLPGDVSGLFAWDGAFDHMMVENDIILGKSQHSQGYIDRAYGRFFDVVLREESTVGLFEHVQVGWFTRQNMLWALSLVWSRCWTQQVGSRSIFRLIPFIDLGNHAPQSLWHTREREGWHMDLLQVEQGYQLSIAEGVQGAGLRSVVTLTYGPYDNLQLFAQYGFVLCPNPFDVAIVVPPMSSGGGHCDEERQDWTDDSHEAGTGYLECRGESHVGERLLEEQNVISAANLLNIRSHEQTASSESTEIWHELLLKTDGYETCVEKSKVSAGFAEELGMTLWEHALESDGEGGGLGGVKLSIEYLNGPGANLAKLRIDSDARVRDLWANLIDSLGCHASVER
jgi:hypothetical protein